AAEGVPGGGLVPRREHAVQLDGLDGGGGGPELELGGEDGGIGGDLGRACADEVVEADQGLNRLGAVVEVDDERRGRAEACGGGVGGGGGGGGAPGGAGGGVEG